MSSFAIGDYKGDRLEDLRKARWYLEREIANEEAKRDMRADAKRAHSANGEASGPVQRPPTPRRRRPSCRTAS